MKLPLFPHSQRFDLPFQDPSQSIGGGTNVLIQNLLNFFSAEEILFNEQVERILIEGEQAKIKTNNRTFLANRTICCLPSALLVNSVGFVPELPELVSRAAHNTHTWMQESIKVGVVY